MIGPPQPQPTEPSRAVLALQNGRRAKLYLPYSRIARGCLKNMISSTELTAESVINQSSRPPPRLGESFAGAARGAQSYYLLEGRRAAGGRAARTLAPALLVG